MSKRRADHQPGYVLHTYPYKETSLIVEVFTRNFGRVALLARGARRPRSAMRGVLLAFHPLRLGWSASAELGNLMSVEWSGAPQPLAGRGLMCGFYLNELLLRLLPRDDPHETLFDFYAEALRALSLGGEQAPILRMPSGETSGAPRRCIMCMSVAVIGRAAAGEANAKAAADAAARSDDLIMSEA